MSNYNNVNRVLIGDGTNSGATSLPGIQKGDLYLLNEAGAIITTNAAAAALPKFEKVVVAAGIGPGIAILSSPIQGNTVSAYEGKGYRAPAEQVAYVGYNGTPGTGISISASTEYRLRIQVLDDHRFNGQRQTFSDYHYVGGASASEQDAIDTIACYYAQTDYGHAYMNDKVRLLRVSDGTFTALSNDAAVVQGSKIVVSTAHGIAAPGGYVRIGGTGFDAPIYKVAEVVDANTINLDVPFLGDSGTVLAANVGVMSAQTEYGFKLTGLAQDPLLSRNANEPWDQYEWILFKAYFSEADDRSFDSAATYTEAIKVDPGNGFWRQVAEREEDAKGYLGDTSKRRFHDNRIDSNVVNGTAYDTIVITHYDIHKGDFQADTNSPLLTEIYIPDGADQGLNSGDNFVHVLNGFFSDVLGFPAISF